MVSRIYIEGGGDSSEGKARCREGFRELLEKCGYKGRMPRLRACGPRDDAYDDFKTRHNQSLGSGDYVALLVDSEDPVADVNATWTHLQYRDGWQRPPGAADEQVLLMTTCMETWLVADRDALAEHYGQGFQVSALPALNNLEARNRENIQRGLYNATRRCSARYEKGPQSFTTLGKIRPDVIQQHLPSFNTCPASSGRGRYWTPGSDAETHPLAAVGYRPYNAA